MRIEPWNDQDGTNTSSESPELLPYVQSARAEESARLSSMADELFLQAITVLQEASRIAFKAHALVEVRPLNPEAPTTPEQAPALLFMQRLTLYSGLIGTTVTELRSIAPTNPVTDAGGSSKEPVSDGSSPLREEFPVVTEEPPYNSIIIDADGDAWQYGPGGWSCTMGESYYRNFTWNRLLDYGPLRLVRSGE